jgi:fructosamine-3-kinase
VSPDQPGFLHALDFEVTQARRIGGQHGVDQFRLRTAAGRVAFAKVAAGGAEAGFAAEAAGLRWLRAAGSVPVPEVLVVTESVLVIEWVDEGGPTGDAADRFGAALARLHLAGAESFGAPWLGVIAGLALPNDSAAGRFGAVSGPAEPPSRIHGDCWSGNVLWSAGEGWLIDPAAHGGHRETDLAMLALFGAPYLDRILAAYQNVAPLADGWRGRIPMNQLHPLLVHVCLFGSAYREGALTAARAVLQA